MITVSVIRHWLSGVVQHSPYNAQQHRMRAQNAWWMLHAFYITNCLFAYETMYLLMDQYGVAHGTPLAVEPIWFIRFITSANLPVMANMIALFYMGASVLVLLFIHTRWARALLWVAMLMAFGLKYSFGTLNHKEHMWLWVCGVFILLPSQRYETFQDNRNERQYLLDVFAAAQGIVLFFYMLTGLWKIVYGIAGLIKPVGVGIFSLHALPSIAVTHMITAHDAPYLAVWIAAHPVIGWILYLLVTWLEIMAPWVWFRPALHRPWAVIMSLFHIGTWLLMGIVFYLQIPLLALLFIYSPFGRKQYSFREILEQLPFFGRMFRYLKVSRDSGR
jgi:hypothetical protein